jgi:hypothetical protein
VLVPWGQVSIVSHSYQTYFGFPGSDLNLYCGLRDHKVYNACGHSAFGMFYFIDNYLFKKNRLCVPASSLRELLVCEAHGSGLIGHFAVEKTLDVLHEHFYWEKMKKDVQ